MIIRIARTVRLHDSTLRKVVNQLSQIVGPMTFHEERIPIMFEENNFEWYDFFQKCHEYREQYSIPDDDFLVVLTELRNSSNWFSAFSMDGERSIFIHALDWENYIYSEPEFPLSYEVIVNVLDSLAFQQLGKDFFKYTHHEPIGCLNDMCAWKPDISFKLRTGDICPDCLTLMSSIVSKEILEQAVTIFELLRMRMLFNRERQKPMSFEENLPFTIAITKRKLGTTLEPFRKMLMLIDHFDSIVRTSVLMLAGLTKSSHQIQEFLQERNLHDRPSLGSWVDALAVLAKTNATQFPELQLPSDFSTQVQEVVQLANDNKIITIRNEYRGHGYIDCQDSSYKGLFASSITVIENIEQLLSPLFNRFNYYHTISLRRMEGVKFKVLVHVLSGSNPTFVEKEIMAEFATIEELPIEDRFYLVSPDLKKWVDLHPYFQYGECNVCHHNRLLVCDGIYMLDPFIGHRYSVEPLNERH